MVALDEPVPSLVRLLTMPAVVAVREIAVFHSKD
jgi:hypothetical protein